MNIKQMFRYLLLLIVAVLAVIFVASLSLTSGVRAQIDRPTTLDIETFISPLPTPTSAPQPLSPEAKIALNFILGQRGIPISNLQIVNEHQRSYPLIGRTFKAFTIWTRDPKDFREFNLLVDSESGEVEADVNAIVAQEQAAYRARYGKLTPALYERLQQAQEDELLPIAVWMAPDPAASFAQSSRRFGHESLPNDWLSPRLKVY